MADVFDRQTRSRNMSAIRGRDTKPELVVRRFLHSRGLRYRLHVRGLPGRPDLVFLRYRTVVFVHGCFWHRHRGCRFAVLPKSNRRFWLAKLSGNVRRDARHSHKLRRAGWRVLTIWECFLTPSSLLRLERAVRAGLKSAR
jgi:DNA mismatch endonuclease (patch repair protein)